MTGLLRVKVLRPVRILFEQLPATVTEQFVVRYLDLESARVPFVVQRSVVGVDERQLLICWVCLVLIRATLDPRTH